MINWAKKSVWVFVLIGAVMAGSSCKKNRDATGVVIVMKDSVNFISGDSVQVPVVQASVRFYSDQVGSDIDTLIYTNTNGKATFVWFEDVIIKYDVTYQSFYELENYIILEQGETVEETVYID
jgi:hypothetical protein